VVQRTRKSHPNYHMNQHNSEKRASASSVAVGHSRKSETSPCNQKSVQSTAASSKKCKANSDDNSDMHKKNKAKNNYTKAKKAKKAKKDKKKKSESTL
jgi:hypothetical protein